MRHRGSRMGIRVGIGEKRGEKKRQSTLKNFLWSECERLKNKKLVFTALKYIFYFLGLITLPWKQHYPSTLPFHKNYFTFLNALLTPQFQSNTLDLLHYPSTLPFHIQYVSHLSLYFLHVLQSNDQWVLAKAMISKEMVMDLAFLMWRVYFRV